MNSIKQTVLFSLAVATFIMGVHGTIVQGLQANYWLFMLSTVMLMLFSYNRKKEQEKEKQAAAQNRTTGAGTTRVGKKQQAPKKPSFPAKS